MSYCTLLHDRRRGRRADALVRAMAEQRRVQVTALSRDAAEQAAYYRLLRNERANVASLSRGLYQWLRGWGASLKEQGSSGEMHLLLLQDTTEVSFQRHARRLQPGEDLGWLSNNRQHGYNMHPALVVDANAGWLLGIADLKLWARPLEGADKAERRYRDLPIEQKESMRWIRSFRHAARRLRAVLPEAGPGLTLTTIGDREADIFSLLARLPRGERVQTHVLVRSCRDRRIQEAPGSLYRALESAPLAGSEQVWLPGDVRRGHSAGRWVELSYRFTRVTLLRPERSSKPDAGSGQRDPAHLEVSAVEVWERNPPEGQKPIRWRLLTTHAVRTLEEARRVAGWYRQRWFAEQLFRVLKADGLDLESSELERGAALQRLGVLALCAAVDVLRLLLAERATADPAQPNEQPTAQPLEHAFSAAEVECLKHLAPTYEGRTPKQQNPHPPGSLAWAAWLIARLGGWKGYRSQHRAGPATYHRGLQRFHDLFFGWRLAQTDVLYKP